MHPGSRRSAQSVPSEAAPPTDEACTVPQPGASLPGAPCPSQPRTFMREAAFGNLAQLRRSTRLETSRLRSQSRRFAIPWPGWPAGMTRQVPASVPSRTKSGSIHVRRPSPNRLRPLSLQAQSKSLTASRSSSSSACVAFIIVLLNPPTSSPCTMWNAPSSTVTGKE